MKKSKKKIKYKKYCSTCGFSFDYTSFGGFHTCACFR